MNSCGDQWTDLLSWTGAAGLDSLFGVRLKMLDGELAKAKPDGRYYLKLSNYQGPQLISVGLGWYSSRAGLLGGCELPNRKFGVRFSCCCCCNIQCWFSPPLQPLLREVLVGNIELLHSRNMR